MTTPNAGIPEVPEGTLDPAAGLNDSLRVIDALIQCACISMTLTAPPGTSADGDRYIVDSPATGAWDGHENDLAQYVAEGDFWLFYEAGVQVHQVQNLADFRLYAFDQTSSPGTWSLISGGGLTVMDSNSPQLIAADVTALRFDGATVTEESDGTVVVTVTGGGAAEQGHGPLTTIAIASNIANMDHSAGADFQLTLTANVTTFNHQNLTNGEGNWFTLLLRQDGTGGRTFAVPASWTYGSGVSAYTVSAGANDVDLIQGVSYDDGTTWRISYEKDFT